VTRSSPTIRVASWNIRAAIGPGEPFPPAWWRHVDTDRLQSIAEIIVGFDADLVALQEVAVFNADGALVDQPADLARLTGLHVRYGAVNAYPLIEPEWGRAIGSAMWGNALLSRRTLEDGFVVDLPSGGDDEPVEPAGSGLPLAGVTYAEAEPGAREPRCAVGGRLVEPETSLSIITSHLTYAGANQRRAQAETLAGLATGLASPAIVAGDLNAPIETAELSALASSFDDAFSAVGIEPGDPGRASCGTHRIDHLLLRGLRTLECRVHREAGDASDHFPVVAVLEPAPLSAGRQATRRRSWRVPADSEVRG
jgi:endonuclease/exonuclease/phosphatase family metal-dependent hydrolase